MQIWIYFVPGAGGDGFANLVEQCPQISRFDAHPHHWRIHRFVDDLPKFWAPVIDSNHYFRYMPKQPFDLQNNQLVPLYVEFVLQNKHIVCTSHQVSLKYANEHECKQILTKDLVKVLVTCQDPVRNWRLSTIKRLDAIAVESIRQDKISVDETLFDYVLDIDQIHSDWTYVKKFCADVDLDLSESAYRTYQAILAGSMPGSEYTAPRYKSSVVNGVLSYSKIESQ